jgi:DNA-binding FadR family transcriptional regulator
MSEIIQRRKLYQEVADRLEALILSGAFQIGDPLPSERDLMERFGVGRPAIREALMTLERAGLIAISGGERARVTRPTAEGLMAGLNMAVRQWLNDEQGVSHLQDARGLLEVGLARRAAETARDAEIAVLRRALEANETARGDPASFERTDVAFHYVLAEMSGNPIFTALHQAMVGWLTEQRTMSLRAAGAEAAAAAGHRRIFAAVAARDPAAAGHEMRRHLDEVARLYWHARAGNEPS